jgi:uncharacterized protein YndB with AHSA1/START domain
MSKKVLGKTKSVGFEMGIRRTFAITPEEAWDFIFSEAGIATWFGTVKGWQGTVKEPFKSSGGNEGTLTVVKPYSHLRMRFKKKAWDHQSTLQIRVLKTKGGTTLAFHHEFLTGTREREEMLEHWEKVLKKIEKQLTNKDI